MNKKCVTISVIAVVLSVITGAGVFWFETNGGDSSGQPQNDMVVDAATRNAVVDTAIANLDRTYVFPDIAVAMEKKLRVSVAEKRFDGISSAEKFADVLTDLLRDESHDKHLVVRYFEHAIPEPAGGADDVHKDDAEALHQRRLNFGIENVGRFRGNIGYIDLHSFGRPKNVTDRIAAAMTLLADTSALIVDLRRCGGGDPDTVMLFASYLFDHRMHLNDIYFRDENRTEERWTTDTVAGSRYGEARRIFLLTSDDTFSGCEDFAYALKNAGRATLVGETTGGGAHAGSPTRLSAHFMMFVPSGRPISPVTHTDWEGVGVAPDIKTSARKALDVAQIAALKALIASEQDVEWKGRLQNLVDELE